MGSTIFVLLSQKFDLFALKVSCLSKDDKGENSRRTRVDISIRLMFGAISQIERSRRSSVLMYIMTPSYTTSPKFCQTPGNAFHTPVAVESK